MPFRTLICRRTRLLNAMRQTRRTQPLDVIDRFLMSDRAPDNSMGLSDLDGFLTGIVIGSELVMPSEWSPIIWGNESPRYKDGQQAQTLMSAIMDRYNEIVRGFQQMPPDFKPVFWETKDGLTIAADWAEGLNDAIKLRPHVWKKLEQDNENAYLLRPVMILCGSEASRGRDAEAKFTAKATDDLIDNILAIHQYWR
jgi:uncharacterized protein